MNIEAIESALGLQPGESYAEETAITRETRRRWRGVPYVTYYDEAACMWRAFAAGIGTASHWHEDRAVALMRAKIDSLNP